jgi:ribosomal protein L11 methyltransferase
MLKSKFKDSEWLNDYFRCMNTIKLIIDIDSNDEAEILMAQLAAFEPNGFEELPHELHVFFDENILFESEINATLSSKKVRKEIIPQQNWNALWESNFDPIRVHHDIGIRAHFHPAFIDCKYAIEITPKMSFGTGHHETTHSMLELIGNIDCTSKSVFDFGCGTGVLAILAKMKGAHRVLGIDNDDWSIQNAIENCGRNECEVIEISNQDVADIKETFDIILANINLNVLLANMTLLKTYLNAYGDLLLSGILDSDLDEMKNCLLANNLHIQSVKQRKKWIALHVK